MQLTRRTFLQGATACAVAPATAAGSGSGSGPGSDNERHAVLVDSTLCVGCRSCEAACAEANALPDPLAEEPVATPGPAASMATTTSRFTVVHTAAAGEIERFVKMQCMHCVDPACASACPTRALEKTPGGPVVYHASRCLGCRYCMVSCPFGVPRYEYESLAPRVRKCTFCAERQSRGEPPACVAACPTGALTYGKRNDLLQTARERVHAPGSTYVGHVFGENEVGGTSWLYVTDIPLDKLGLPDNLGARAHSSLTGTALGAVPAILILWPALLLGIYNIANRRPEASPGYEGGPRD